MKNALELACRFRLCSLDSSFLFGILILGLLLGLGGTAQGQDNSKDRNGWGYGFGAVGASYESGCCGEGMVHFGGGVEATLLAGFGPAVEIGYASNFAGWGLGIFSPGVIYAFNRDKDTVPFVTGGYTLFFRQGTAHGFFFGGGVNQWIGDRWGIRIEGRDQVWYDYDVHMLEVRFAFVFR